MRTTRWMTLLCVVTMLSALSAAQEPGNAELQQTIRAMQKQIAELQRAVADLQSEAAQKHSAEVSSGSAGAYSSSESTSTPYDSRRDSGSPSSTGSLSDDVRLLAAKVDDQFQTKVESGSRYRVKLSGMVLLNMFENRGTVDSIDLPSNAQPPTWLYGNGSFGATLRQSQIGLDVQGPTWAGARVSGNVRFDFAGGFADVSNGSTLGIMRLRTGGVRLDWKTASLIAGQEAPLFSPLSPTSLASQAEPALSYSGNLWTWIPQISLEKRFLTGEKSWFAVQGGIMDPQTGYLPQTSYDRLPTAGEASRQPAYALHLGWNRGQDDDATSFGAGGFYSRQDWAFGRQVDAYAGTLDWQIALPARFAFSGEFFRGRGIGGLGAAKDHSILSNGPLANSQTVVQGLDVLGGWAQLKYRATPKLQFNAAVGQDNPYSSELRAFSSTQNLLDPALGKTQTAMFNFIYKPKSNLLFSTEYRHIGSERLNQDHFSAEHINVSIGVLF